MKTLKTLESFMINESVLGKYSTMSMDEMQSVLNSTLEDFGTTDTTKRHAIIKALESAFIYFEMGDPNKIDIKIKIAELSSDETARKKLYGLAKTYVTSLKKIQQIELNEIEPIQSQIQAVLKNQI